MSTRDGLNRYDGHEFKVYRHDPQDPNSLSASFIQSIALDSKGTLWVATTKGLNRLIPGTDGHFERFLHDPSDLSSFPYNNLGFLLIDQRDRLWILADTMLIQAEDDNGTMRYKTYPCKGLPNGLPTARLRQGFLDEKGEQPGIWIGTIGGGLFFMPFARPGTFESFQAHPTRQGALRGNRIRNILRDRSGVLWVATEDAGLFKMTSHGVFQQFAPVPNDDHALSSTWINALYEDRAGRLWVGSYDKGLYLMEDRNANRFFHFPHQPSQKYSLSSNQVWTISEDRSGQIWVGTYGGGVNHFDPNGAKFRTYSYGPEGQGLSDNNISTFVVDNDNGIWAATNSHGLNHVRRKNVHGQTRFKLYTNDPKDPKSLPDDILTAMSLDNRDTLWIGTRNHGLLSMRLSDPGQFRTFLPDANNPNRLPKDRIATILAEDDRIWVGTDSGMSWTSHKDLGTFRTFSESANPQSLSHNWVMDFSRTPDGTLYVATYGGGLNKVLDENNGRFFTYRHQKGNPKSLCDDSIRTLRGMPDNTLWIGTANGLSHFTPQTGHFKSYHTSDGLPNSVIYAIEVDHKGQIWTSTNLGLSRLDPTSESFTNFTIRDGLQGNEFNSNASYKAPNGELLFAGTQGITAFDPEKIQPNLKPPTPGFTQLMVANKVIKPMDTHAGETPPKDASPILKIPIEVAQDIYLSYTEADFTLKFTALHYELPAKQRFQYKLTPYEKAWREVNADVRMATYTNLESGTYTFHLKAANSDGIWSQEVRTLKIHVSTPPWNTWWARGLYGLLIFLIIIWYIRTQNLKLERERLKVEHLKQVEKLKDEFNASLEQKVKDRTRELQGTRRKLVETARLAGMAEIASDVLHGVGNSLNSVKTSIHFMQEMVDDERCIVLLERLAERLSDHEKYPTGSGSQPTENRAEFEKALTRIAKKLRHRQDKLNNESLKLFAQVQSIIGVLWDQQKHTQKKDWSLEMADLNQTVEEAIYFDGYILRERNIHINLDLDNVAPVSLDKTKISRIFYFLFKNATEAIAQARREQGVVNISTHQEASATICTIEDNGCGIDDKCLEKIFVHGFTTKESHEGFGLHYCANAMKEMAGTIYVESEGGIGTKIHLSFPHTSYA